MSEQDSKGIFLSMKHEKYKNDKISTCEAKQKESIWQLGCYFH